MDIEEPNRYRDLAMVLWYMILNYANVSIRNIDVVLELFETSVNITNELAVDAERIDGDQIWAQTLNNIVLETNNVKFHLQELTHEIINGVRNQTNGIPTPQLTAPNNAACNGGNSSATGMDTHSAARNQTVAAMKEYPSGEGLEAVAGMKEAKEIIEAAVILPVLHPNLFVGRDPCRSIFLYGPPGTGKTRLAHAVAAEIGAAFYSLCSSTLLSSWFGESEKMVREIFNQVRGSNEKCVVFIDEIDGICRKRATDDGETSRRLKSELLVQMNDLPRSTFLIAATNCPWDIDPAFSRRFQRRVYIPLPDSSARLNIILAAVGSCATSLSRDEWNQVADLTAGYSGSDLTDLTQTALMMPIGELSNAKSWVVRQSDNMWIPVDDEYQGARINCKLRHVPPNKAHARNVELRDFQAAIANTSKTVSQEDINSYLKFNAKYA